MATALLVTEDLFVASQVNAQLGALVPVTQVSRCEDLAGVITERDVCLLLIDLSSRLASVGLGSLPQLREEFPRLRVVGFGPHVQTARLDEAERAGCDLVLTRGQMLRDGARLLGALVPAEGE